MQILTVDTISLKKTFVRSKLLSSRGVSWCLVCNVLHVECICNIAQDEAIVHKENRTDEKPRLCVDSRARVPSRCYLCQQRSPPSTALLRSLVSRWCGCHRLRCGRLLLVDRLRLDRLRLRILWLRRLDVLRLDVLWLTRHKYCSSSPHPYLPLIHWAEADEKAEWNE